jgi:hypothetical protein
MNLSSNISDDKRKIGVLQEELDELRLRLNVSRPDTVLYQETASGGWSRILLVVSDGFGGASLMVVEGNYPVDYWIHENISYSTEGEALEVAEMFWAKQVFV